MPPPKSLSRTSPSIVAATSIASSLLTVQTSGVGFTDLTGEVAKFLGEAAAREGMVTLFIRHTSASLTIQENADPTVLVDLTTVNWRPIARFRYLKRSCAPSMLISLSV